MQVYHLKDKTDELDHQFKEYLKGKNVAVVGCSALDDLEQGKFIDSHDVVVRIHSPIPYTGYEGQAPRADLGIEPDWSTPTFVPEEWQSRIGKRVNVFYHKEHAPSRMKNLISLFRAAGGQFLCREFWCYVHDYGQVLIHHMMPCRFLTTNHDLNVMEAVGTGVYAGTQVIGDILRHDICSLYLTGFPTFFDKAGRFLSTAPQGEVHMAFHNVDWLRQLCDSHEKIAADPNMTTLFNVMPANWKEYECQYLGVHSTI